MKQVLSKSQELVSEGKYFTFKDVSGEYNTENLIKAAKFMQWQGKARDFLEKLYGERHKTIVEFNRATKIIEDADNENEFNIGHTMMLNAFKYALNVADDNINIKQNYFYSNSENKKVTNVKNILSNLIEEKEKEIKNISFKDGWEELAKSELKRDKRQLQVIGFINEEDFNFYETNLGKEYFDVTGRMLTVLKPRDYEKFFIEMLDKLDNVNDKEWDKFIDEYFNKRINIK
ncbi:MAG: hypothetical protein NTX22_06170 [Ignavibacteriales bacterium]|nr:hypothetical protein [Ignavibacteriales bacterium]